ncbi:hypothetical protein HK100_004759 [Physocladia obscura]|uniref:Uncharacterized protein n=1 Tax=Physocladia obscura TaxID=109957 RepID=A0AAD5XJ05_9FUNG|nr:hypothetical protein HK100_004759 [Physocladia obscura]
MEKDIEDVDRADLPMKEANNDNQTDINGSIGVNEADNEKKNVDIKFVHVELKEIKCLIGPTRLRQWRMIAEFDKTDPKTEPHMNMVDFVFKVFSIGNLYPGLMSFDLILSQHFQAIIFLEWLFVYVTLTNFMTFSINSGKLASTVDTKLMIHFVEMIPGPLKNCVLKRKQKPTPLEKVKEAYALEHGHLLLLGMHTYDTDIGKKDVLVGLLSNSLTQTNELIDNLKSPEASLMFYDEPLHIHRNTQLLIDVLQKYIEKYNYLCKSYCILKMHSNHFLDILHGDEDNLFPKKDELKKSEIMCLDNSNDLIKLLIDADDLLVEMNVAAAVRATHLSLFTVLDSFQSIQTDILQSYMINTTFDSTACEI